MTEHNHPSSHSCGPRLLSIVLFGAMALAAMSAGISSVIGQQPAERARSVNSISASAADTSNPAATRDSDDQYRIGPGDQLTIQVFNRAQLSRDERVDVRGMIRVPLIEEDIRAACRTENELAEEIARLYRERQLLKNPSVYVAVKDFQSQPVAVVGSVNSPGKFILQRRIRLLELLVFHAGGPSATAGRQVQVLSTVPYAPCETPTDELAAGADKKAEVRFATYNLRELLAGKEAANPYVRQGDVINLPAAQQAMILGNVRNPSAIPLPEPITLSRALAMVGGTLPNTKKDKIRVLREVAGASGTNEILVDLNATDKSMGQDFLLQGGDIVEVATNGGFRNILHQLETTALPMLIGLPTRVVRY